MAKCCMLSLCPLREWSPYLASSWPALWKLCLIGNSDRGAKAVMRMPGGCALGDEGGLGDNLLGSVMLTMLLESWQVSRVSRLLVKT